MKKNYILIVFIFTVGYVFSQNDSIPDNDFVDMTIEDLMNIEVTTPSKISQKAADAPATVYVITHQQIEERNYSCLIELLEDIPQIEIQKKSRAETSNFITLNGVAGNEKFILMMDGVRVNSTTGTVHKLGESYSLANTKQVEIILGPASSLYGADAFTGIINIVTYKGHENNGFHINSSYGRFNTIDNTLVYNLGNEDISLSVSGKYYHSDEPFFPDYFPDEYAWYEHYQQTGEMQMFGDTVMPAFGIKPWETPTDAYSVQLKFNYKNFEAGYSNFNESHSNSIGSPPDTYVYSKDAIWSNSLQNIYVKHSYLSENEKFGLNSTVSAQEFKVNPKSLFLNQYAGYLNAYKYENNKTVKAEEQFNYSFSDKFNIVGGASFEYINSIPKTSDLPYKYDETKSIDEQNIYYPGTNVTDSAGNDLTIIQDIYNLNYHNIGSYLQLQAQIIENLTLTAGTRFDYNSRYKSTINPRIGLVYKLWDRINIKLLYGHAYLAPSPYKSHQHYGSFYPTKNENDEITGFASSFWHLPNPDLEPEKRTSYDAFVMYQINENLVMSINGYYGLISNLIGKEGYEDLTFHGVPIGYVTKTVNKGDATAYGGTIKLDYRTELSDNLSTDIFVAYSYSDGEIVDNPLIFSAKHTIKAGFGIRCNDRCNIYSKILFRTGSHSRISTNDENIKNDAFTIINITGNYKIINKEKLKISLFANVSNLLNSKYYNAGYESFEQTPQDPIRIDFGLKFDF